VIQSLLYVPSSCRHLLTPDCAEMWFSCEIEWQHSHCRMFGSALYCLEEVAASLFCVLFLLDLVLKPNGVETWLSYVVTRLHNHDRRRCTCWKCIGIQSSSFVPINADKAWSHEMRGFRRGEGKTNTAGTLRSHATVATMDRRPSQETRETPQTWSSFLSISDWRRWVVYKHVDH
jgi:hypothetical protein